MTYKLNDSHHVCSKILRILFLFVSPSNTVNYSDIMNEFTYIYIYVHIDVHHLL